MRHNRIHKHSLCHNLSYAQLVLIGGVRVVGKPVGGSEIWACGYADFPAPRGHPENETLPHARTLFRWAPCPQERLACLARMTTTHAHASVGNGTPTAGTCVRCGREWGPSSVIKKQARRMTGLQCLGVSWRLDAQRNVVGCLFRFADEVERAGHADEVFARRGTACDGERLSQRFGGLRHSA